MQLIKYVMLLLIFLSSFLIGKCMSKQYIYRLKELEEIKNALNIFKTKIKFTYEPIPEIFTEISKTSNYNISEFFMKVVEKMKNKSASEAWEEGIDEIESNLTQQDKQTIKTLSKLLGTTDVDGQVSQIEVTESFLEEQIRQAQEEKNKNEKLYQQLGMTIGLAIVIILI